MIQGINICSTSPDLLGRQLTNPCYAKNNISEFDIDPNQFFPKHKWIHPKDLILHKNKFKWVFDKYDEEKTAENIWGKSVEAWYFSNVIRKIPDNISSYERGPIQITINPLRNFIQNPMPIYYELLLFQKESVMELLIYCKFKTYPFLIEEINKRGGLDFLKICSHIVRGNRHWEGVGENSNFIRLLIKTYIKCKGDNHATNN